MKQYQSPFLNHLYTLYRIIRPVIDPIWIVKGIIYYPRFISDYIKYNKQLNKKEKLKFKNIFPIVNEATNLTPFDSHYYYQQIWAFKNIYKNKPEWHVDVASSYELSGYVSTITKSVFVDYRPIPARLDNLEIRRGNILNLDFKDNSIPSISCLHVVEHIGLGRYGDPLDPEGTAKALAELQRVVQKGGLLYLSTLIGKSRTCFNAHRIFSPEEIIERFDECELVSFSAVSDTDVYIEKASTDEYKDCAYCCGMFVFKKK